MSRYKFLSFQSLFSWKTSSFNIVRFQALVGESTTEFRVSPFASCCSSWSSSPGSGKVQTKNIDWAILPKNEETKMCDTFGYCPNTLYRGLAGSISQFTQSFEHRMGPKTTHSLYIFVSHSHTCATPTLTAGIDRRTTSSHRPAYLLATVDHWAQAPSNVLHFA